MKWALLFLISSTLGIFAQSTQQTNPLLSRLLGARSELQKRNSTLIKDVVWHSTHNIRFIEGKKECISKTRNDILTGELMAGYMSLGLSHLGLQSPVIMSSALLFAEAAVGSLIGEEIAYHSVMYTLDISVTEILKKNPGYIFSYLDNAVQYSSADLSEALKDPEVNRVLENLASKIEILVKIEDAKSIIEQKMNAFWGPVKNTDVTLWFVSQDNNIGYLRIRPQVVSNGSEHSIRFPWAHIIYARLRNETYVIDQKITPVLISEMPFESTSETNCLFVNQKDIKLIDNIYLGVQTNLENNSSTGVLSMYFLKDSKYLNFSPRLKFDLSKNQEK